MVEALTFSLAADEVLQEVHGDEPVARQVEADVLLQELVELPLRRVLGRDLLRRDAQRRQPLEGVGLGECRLPVRL